MFTAILAWLKIKKTFLKVQLGTGDNGIVKIVNIAYVVEF